MSAGAELISSPKKKKKKPLNLPKKFESFYFEELLKINNNTNLVLQHVKQGGLSGIIKP